MVDLFKGNIILWYVVVLVAFAAITYVFYRFLFRHRKKRMVDGVFLNRSHKNPMISPHHNEEWGAQGTFNPAAIFENGKTHLIYRSVGPDGVSRLAYASSSDFHTFDEHISHPVYVVTCPMRDTLSMKYDPVMYPSGGSWGGCEDPRMVRIDNKIYVTFSAFDGWDFIRMGVVSIDIDDFNAKKWKWSRPLLISPPGQIHKNWVIFPEKIHGKFAIMHSISPNIQIDYVDRLEDLAYGHKVIKSNFTHPTIRKSWDTRVRGVGPPPLKTKWGWLVLYHATDKKEPHKYKLGALLLDLKNPKKVIGRALNPILVPDEWYENDGKPGVVYATGAIIQDETLYVYYGGGDRHVCVAHIAVKDLINHLKK